MTTNIYNMTDTWNNAATVFTAIQMNVTDTASQAASLLMDLQVGGVSKFSVDKAGVLRNAVNSVFLISTATVGYPININGGLQIYSTLSRTLVPLSFSQLDDVQLSRDAAGVLAQQNGANAQTLRVYQTFTDTLNYARAAINNTVGQVELAAESAGTGSANIDIKLTPKGTGNVSLPGGTLLKTAATLTNGAAAQTATLTNGPTAGNPTKWIPINDAGVTRYIPAW